MKALLYVLAVVAVTGCLSGVSADELRDGVVGHEPDSYAYESELSIEVTTSDGFGGTQVSTVSTEATVDHTAGAVHEETVSVRETRGDRRVTETTTYLVDGELYMRTTSNTTDSGWVRLTDESEVSVTWETTDDLAVYRDVLQDASVEHNTTETFDGGELHLLDVRLDEDARIDLLLGKLGDDRAFFEGIETESFVLTVGIDEDARLMTARTEASMIAGDRETASGAADLSVTVSFIDTFSYDTSAVELPDEAADAEDI